MTTVGRPRPAAARLGRGSVAAIAACTVLAQSGCAVVTIAGAATGAAVAVTGAVVSAGVGLTGKVIGKTIDAVTPGDK